MPAGHVDDILYTHKYNYASKGFAYDLFKKYLKRAGLWRIIVRRTGKVALYT